jgi:hypothetical protein
VFDFGDTGGTDGGNDDGGTDGGNNCDDGYVEDCSGDGDCCPETWIGDGLCDGEDQAWGCDLTCYDNDGGDCGGRSDANNNQSKDNILISLNSLGAKLSQSEYQLTSTEFSLNPDRIERDENVFNPYLNTSTREFELIGSTTETTFVDNGVFNGTQYCYYIVASNVSGDSGASEQACATPEGPPPLYPPEDLVAVGQVGSIALSWTEPQDAGGDDGGTDGGNDDGGDDGGNGECGQGSCDAGYIEDCSGDGDCCPESWIGDGFEDCEDQAWGCDLTCCDNDGGDCGTGTDGGTDGGTSSCEDCEFDWTPYGSECCDTAWDEYGIDCATLEGVYYWDCAGCECPGDNGGGTTGGGGSGSCVGNCGTSSDTCWCDDSCEDYGDCCADYYDECRDGVTGESYEEVMQRPTYSLDDFRERYIPNDSERDLIGYNVYRNGER